MKGTIIPPYWEISAFRRRLLIASLLALLAVGCLFARLFYLQVHAGAHYATLARQNQLTLLPITPRRGLISDRNGVLLAENIAVTSLEITPEKMTNLPKTLDALTAQLKITPSERDNFERLLKQRRAFEPIPLRLKMSEKDIARFSVVGHLFPGARLHAHLVRHYPLGADFSHVLGHVGHLNEGDLQSLDPVNYSGTHVIGKTGIERFYETALHGKVGLQQVETDVHGKVVRSLKHIAPQPGEDITLTLDSRLQKLAQKLLRGHRGAVVALDPSNGEVLAMASAPSFDPNLFINGMSQQVYDTLRRGKAQPFYNRAVRGQYPIASTIKPFVALSALDAGVITPRKTILDKGFYQLHEGSHRYRDWNWRKGGHGYVNLHKALAESCDTYFYALAPKLGIKAMDTTLHQFGFGNETGIDMAEALHGLIPDPDWKQRMKGDRWYTGDTILSSIGQGFMLTTPLQLAIATGVLSARGHYPQPHLLKSRKTHDGVAHAFVETQHHETVKYAANHWRAVILGMRDVIRTGTGWRFGHTRYSVAGKTGTAQLVSQADDKSLAQRFHDNSMFIAFAPMDKPRIALAVIVENGTAHSPIIARKMIDGFFHFEKEDKHS